MSISCSVRMELSSNRGYRYHNRNASIVRYVRAFVFIVVLSALWYSTVITACSANDCRSSLCAKCGDVINPLTFYSILRSPISN